MRREGWELERDATPAPSSAPLTPLPPHSTQPTAQHAAAVNAAVAAAAAAAAGAAPHLPPTAARRRERDLRARATARKKTAVQRALEEAGAVRRTIYICDIDQSVTEAELAAAFAGCGAIVDCRVCGDPNSAMRFAFIEFRDASSVPAALAKTGTVLGAYPLRVAPSKTAIVPVNRSYLPATADERAQCARTVYAANIDRRVTAADVRAFFEGLCGPVAKLRLLGDGGGPHAARIAFVEFESAASAAAALNCSGALLGSLPIRVSPSKTPVRDDAGSGGGGGGGGGDGGGGVRRKGRRGGGGSSVLANGDAAEAAAPTANGNIVEDGEAAAPAAKADADDAEAAAAEETTAAAAEAPAATAKDPGATPAPPKTAASAADGAPLGESSTGSAATPAGPATPSGGA